MNGNDRAYFDSYCEYEVHERMLNDDRRNAAYQEAISANQEYFKNKVVLDVGAGTGFLSVLCAQAGAVKVYAVEASDMVTIAKDIVEENDVQNIVQVVQGKIENIRLPERVDVIISEWMGFYLLHEGMLDSVLVARDKFLKEDGVLFPDQCELFAAPCSLPSLYSRWDDVCGVVMSTYALALRKSYAGTPRIMTVPFEDLLTEGNSLAEFSLKYVMAEELDELACKFFATSKVNGRCEGICMWFTVTFPALVSGSRQVVLSTASNEPATHWQQTVIVLQEGLQVEKDTLTIGSLKLKRCRTNRRSYDIEFELLNPESEVHPVPCSCCNVRCKIIKAMTEQYDERDENMDGVD